MKNFLNAIYGPCIKGTAPLLSSEGTTLLTDKSQILKRWAEHFSSVLNCLSAISDVASGWLPQVDTNNDLDLPPSLPETIRAMQQISSGKAPGSDASPPAVYKHDRPRLLTESSSLLNIAEKIFTRILLNRLNGHLEQGMHSESQSGIRRQRGTTDKIFTARKLQDKCKEMQTHLYTTFVDLMKAFDTVNRDRLWKVMQKFGCPERFTHMVHQLHDTEVLERTAILSIPDILRQVRLRWSSHLVRMDDERLPKRLSY
ncbi:unnamed protein product [Schistocephalus solidus]|uniref:Reverse transcriptase domain-containing protein n=1 Tax=Schistocephalus solidus TaxID=70667 RepID=A0A183TGU6_SCHSO|nr:unnamed protein product [Schistocephalus solidus]